MTNALEVAGSNALSVEGFMQLLETDSLDDILTPGGMPEDFQTLYPYLKIFQPNSARPDNTQIPDGAFGFAASDGAVEWSPVIHTLIIDFIGSRYGNDEKNPPPRTLFASRMDPENGQQGRVMCKSYDGVRPFSTYHGAQLFDRRDSEITNIGPETLCRTCPMAQFKQTYDRINDKKVKKGPVCPEQPSVVMYVAEWDQVVIWQLSNTNQIMAVFGGKPYDTWKYAGPLAKVAEYTLRPLVQWTKAHELDGKQVPQWIDRDAGGNLAPFGIIAVASRVGDGRYSQYYIPQFAVIPIEKHSALPWFKAYLAAKETYEKEDHRTKLRRSEDGHATTATPSAPAPAVQAPPQPAPVAHNAAVPDVYLVEDGEDVDPSIIEMFNAVDDGALIDVDEPELVVDLETSAEPAEDTPEASGAPAVSLFDDDDIPPWNS